MSVDELRSAALRGLRLTVISRPIIEVVLFASMVLLARLIPPAEFGRYAVALFVTQLLWVPSNGIGTALVQRPKGGSREYLQTGFALCIILALVLAAFTLLSATFIVAPIFGERTAVLVRLLALAVPLTAPTTVSSAILARRLAFRRQAVLQLVNIVVSSGAQVGLALAGLDAKALVLGGLVGALVATILTCAYAPPPMPRLRRSIARDIWTLGWPSALSAVSWAAFSNCDYAIIGARLGPVQAGYYFRAYTLGVDYQRKISQVLPNMGFPILARASGADDRDALLRRMVRLITLLLFPGLALLAILAPELVPVVYGPRWTPTVDPTQVIVAAGAAMIVVDATSSALMASGRSRALLCFCSSHFVVYALAVFIVSPLGITAVAWAAVIVHGLFMVISYVLVLRRGDDQPERSTLAALGHLVSDLAPAMVGCAVLMGAALCTGLIASAAHAPALARLAAMTVAGVIAYLAVLRAIYPSSLRTLRNLVVHLLPRRPLQLVARLSPLGSAGS